MGAREEEELVSVLGRVRLAGEDIEGLLEVALFA